MKSLLMACFQYGPRQTNLVLIAYASSEGSGEPVHPRSLARLTTLKHLLFEVTCLFTGPIR